MLQIFSTGVIQNVVVLVSCCGEIPNEKDISCISHGPGVSRPRIRCMVTFPNVAQLKYGRQSGKVDPKDARQN